MGGHVDGLGVRSETAGFVRDAQFPRGELFVSYETTLAEALKIEEDFGERISSYAMVMVVVVMMMVMMRKMRKKSKLEGEELLLCVIT
jgi:hypothetical protein